ncbi:MAG: hypothetical protein RBT47_08315 [Anaerolineae bacterium]|jgi:hypothetical protein|nr:hypothetical protein [Anaerolineae bacterium]
MSEQAKKETVGRRGFLYTVLGGAIAAVSGWMAGFFPKEEPIQPEEPDLSAAETRIAALEDLVARLETELARGVQPIAQLEGDMGERIIFNKSELSVINPEGVLLNLVATQGHVGIRFYKDFDFGNEKVTGPWHMGFIEGVEGYQGLAILRDWQFTAALWDEDGKLLVGRLHSHPPANEPAEARFQVRGALDEVQAIVQANAEQSADIFRVTDAEGTGHLAVNGTGDLVVGSPDAPKEVVLYDTVDQSAYSLSVTNGQLSLTKL